MRTQVTGTKWLGVVAVVLTTATAAASEQWRHYTNARYGTSADVPADFRTGPAPLNDDGRTFTSPDSQATITVFASYAPVTVTEGFEAYEQWFENEARSDGLIVSYRSRGRYAFVLSGTKAGRILYRRIIAGCPDHSVAHEVSIEYEAKDKLRYDAIVTHVARSLSPGEQSFCR